MSDLYLWVMKGLFHSVFLVDFRLFHAHMHESCWWELCCCRKTSADYLRHTHFFIKLLQNLQTSRLFTTFEKKSLRFCFLFTIKHWISSFFSCSLVSTVRTWSRPVAVYFWMWSKTVAERRYKKVQKN